MKIDCNWLSNLQVIFSNNIYDYEYSQKTYIYRILITYFFHFPFSSVGLHKLIFIILIHCLQLSWPSWCWCLCTHMYVCMQQCGLELLFKVCFHYDATPQITWHPPVKLFWHWVDQPLYNNLNLKSYVCTDLGSSPRPPSLKRDRKHSAMLLVSCFKNHFGVEVGADQTRYEMTVDTHPFLPGAGCSMGATLSCDAQLPLSSVGFWIWNTLTGIPNQYQIKLYLPYNLSMYNIYTWWNTTLAL